MISNVISFPGPAGVPADLRAVARRLVEARGTTAGLEVGRAARFAGLDAATSARLHAIAAEIEAIQGFGWHFEGD